jgi:hypothetical protein
MYKRKILILSLSCLLFFPLQIFATDDIPSDSPPSQEPITLKTSWLHFGVTQPNPKVLKLALNAYTKARNQGLDTKGILTLVDYSLPAHKKRLWVIDLKKKKIIYNTLVAHGKNSGGTYANHFSNRSGSLASSIGLFVTEGSYHGSHGYSLRLKGLEKGFNDNAYRRAIVMHGAWYVNESRRITGKSWGCFTVSPRMIKPIISTIKNGTLVFAYGNDKTWLNHSKFI